MVPILASIRLAVESSAGGFIGCAQVVQKFIIGTNAGSGRISAIGRIASGIPIACALLGIRTFTKKLWPSAYSPRHWNHPTNGSARCGL